MDLIEKIKSIHQKNLVFIKIFFEENKNIFYQYDKKTIDYSNKLINFISNGKGIRGALVFISDSIFLNDKNIDKQDLLKISAFFEIIHSSLLIHDDIMDNDEKRRGQPTIHRQFYLQYKKYTIDKNDYFDKSLALCLGDISIFLAFKLINQIKTDEKNKSYLINFLQDELIKVGLAQMDDILFSQTKIEPSLDEIKKIYLYKTARYTFVLPILSILILKNFSKKIIKSVEKILEHLGIIFQITDDKIGLLSEDTGKDLASDIRENKKTIIRYLFLKNKNIKNDVKNLFGKKIDEKELKLIQKFYNDYIDKEIKKIINKEENEIEKLIIKNKNIIPEEFIQLINQLIHYLKNRNK